MPTQLHELREEIDHLSAAYERLLGLWQQDLARVIGELGVGLEQVRVQVEAIEAEESSEEQP
jgi:hypothetical protein